MPDDVQQYIDNFNSALDADTATQERALRQQRLNQFAGINEAANSSGVLFSNLPELKQVQYDAETYIPGLNEIRTTALTTRDKIAENARSIMNKIFGLRAATSDLKRTSSSTAGTGTSNSTPNSNNSNSTIPKDTISVKKSNSNNSNLSETAQKQREVAMWYRLNPGVPYPYPLRTVSGIRYDGQYTKLPEPNPFDSGLVRRR